MREDKMDNQNFFFIQMTDPQFGMFTANADFQQEVVLLQQAIAQANRLRAKFVILTGDIINEPGDENQLSAVLAVTSQLDQDIKLFFIPGNHDIGDAPTIERINWFRQKVHQDWYDFNLGNWHFIALNSNIIFNDQNAPDEYQKQWQWLNQNLKHARQQHIENFIIFMHHSLFMQEPDEPDDEYFNIPQRVRYDYLELFRKYQVRAILAGHRHLNLYGKDGPMEMITTAPVGMPLGDDPSGFRIVKVYPDHIEHQYYGLDQIPGSVDF
ncbi:MAG: hypothetical protein GY869_23230 [Planctomycetes bacterium]|nr:hypothetical protein [Planctomycetota bacterium]